MKNGKSEENINDIIIYSCVVLYLLCMYEYEQCELISFARPSSSNHSL